MIVCTVTEVLADLVGQLGQAWLDVSGKLHRGSELVCCAVEQANIDEQLTRLVLDVWEGLGDFQAEPLLEVVVLHGTVVEHKCARAVVVAQFSEAQTARKEV